MKKRMGYLELHETVALTNSGLTVRARNKSGKCLGRVVINRAGVEVYTGPMGKRHLFNLSWERFFERLEKKR